LDLIFESETAQWYRTKSTKRLDRWMREESPITKSSTHDYNIYLVHLKATNEDVYVFRTRDDGIIECKTFRNLEDCAGW